VHRWMRIEENDHGAVTMAREMLLSLSGRGAGQEGDRKGGRKEEVSAEGEGEGKANRAERLGPNRDWRSIGLIVQAATARLTGKRNRREKDCARRELRRPEGL